MSGIFKQGHYTCNRYLCRDYYVYNVNYVWPEKSDYLLIFSSTFSVFCVYFKP